MVPPVPLVAHTLTHYLSLQKARARTADRDTTMAFVQFLASTYK